MDSVDRDWLVRQHTFSFLEELTIEHGDLLPWSSLSAGFEMNGERVTLIETRGIWKPASLGLPISIATSWKDPYGDVANDEGLLQYRYFGPDASHPDNVGLRRCLNEGRPLVYFRAVTEVGTRAMADGSSER